MRASSEDTSRNLQSDAVQKRQERIDQRIKELCTVAIDTMTKEQVLDQFKEIAEMIPSCHMMQAHQLEERSLALTRKYQTFPRPRITRKSVPYSQNL
jgi:hypothetical protein